MGKLGIKHKRQEFMIKTEKTSMYSYFDVTEIQDLL